MSIQCRRREIGSENHLSGERKGALVSVAASPFSGATLLGFLLGAHPQIATIGEMDGLIPREDPDEYLCSCGQKIRACAFWQRVTIAMRSRGFEFDVAHFGTKFAPTGPKALRYLRYGSSRNHFLDEMRDGLLYAWPSERRALVSQVARNEAFIESVLEVMDKEVFVDTSRDRLRLKAMRRYSGYKVRAVHLVRDVRGVVASELGHGRSKAADEAARKWVKTNRKIETALQSWPERDVMLLRYEEICQDVPRTLERLYRFCGVESDSQGSDFRAVPQHIIGNVMRLERGTEIRLDERWKESLAPDQLARIRRVTHYVVRRYGYL